jgi:hypothetical protein
MTVAERRSMMGNWGFFPLKIAGSYPATVGTRERVTWCWSERQEENEPRSV